MTWTNAYTIGPCTTNTYIDPSYPLDPSMAATTEQLTAAGLIVSVVGGQVTVTWDGVTGSDPQVAVQVVPTYPINGMAAQLASVIDIAPSIGAGQIIDGLPTIHLYNPIPQPWAMSQQPTTDLGATPFYGE